MGWRWLCWPQPDPVEAAPHALSRAFRFLASRCSARLKHAISRLALASSASPGMVLNSSRPARQARTKSLIEVVCPETKFTTFSNSLFRSHRPEFPALHSSRGVKIEIPKPADHRGITDAGIFVNRCQI